ncbi:MAG: S9 family peptidase [Syntrophus sp. (in: bacteria)]
MFRPSSYIFACFLIYTITSSLLNPTVASATNHPFSVRDMLDMERVADPQVSPDGRRVAFTVWRADLTANRGHISIQLTDFHKNSFPVVNPLAEADDTNPRWSPDSKTLYFLSTRSGSQQVWKASPPYKKPILVTNLPLDVGGFEVSPDGRFLILSLSVFPGKTPEETGTILAEKANQTGSGMLFDRLMVRNWNTWNNGTRNHLFFYPLPGGPARDLMAAMDADCPSKPTGGTEEFSLSPDGGTLVFAAKDEGRQEAWSTNSDLFMVSPRTETKPVRITKNPATDTQPRFSPDGRILAYLAMSQPGHEADRYRIRLRDMASGKERSLDLRSDDAPNGDRSPDFMTWSHDGKTLYCTADHLGQHALFAMDVATGKSRIIMKTGNTFSPQPLPDGRILFAWNSLNQPTELYLLGINNEESRRVTKWNDDRVEKIRFGKVGAFTFNGAHGDTVYGRIVYPVDFAPARKYPVAFIIHGGPETSNLNEFHYRWNPQIYAGSGYAVVQIDFHGSTGYGQIFTDSIRGDWGGAPYEDLMTGLDFSLKEYPFLDEKRMAALGPSYGGYMINWIGGQTDRFRCLVSHAGLFDKPMAHYEMDTLWFPEWEFGDPKRHNPLDYIKNWRTPTLIIHGQKDYRVSYTQSLALFSALQRQGVPSELLIFPDEGHWILTPRNVLQWHDTVLAWLRQWLRVKEGIGVQ